MEMDDLFKAGSDIMRDVSQAVESGDYSHLSGSIKEHVTQVTDQFGQEVAQGARKFADSMSQGTASGGPKGRNYFLQRKPNRNAGAGKKIAGIVLAVMHCFPLLSLPALQSLQEAARISSSSLPVTISTGS